MTNVAHKVLLVFDKKSEKELGLPPEKEMPYSNDLCSLKAGDLVDVNWGTGTFRQQMEFMVESTFVQNGYTLVIYLNSYNFHVI